MGGYYKGRRINKTVSPNRNMHVTCVDIKAVREIARGVLGVLKSTTTAAFGYLSAYA